MSTQVVVLLLTYLLLLNTQYNINTKFVSHIYTFYILTNDEIKYDLAKFLFSYFVILFKDKNGLYATQYACSDNKFVSLS